MSFESAPETKRMISSSPAAEESISLLGEAWDRRRKDLVLAGRERWYVVQSLPRQEARAEMQLLRQGYRTFLPRMTKTVRHARKLRTVRCPVFPGYLFVALDLQKDRWRSVNGTFGVASLIMAESLPAPAPRGVVEKLLDYMDESGLARFDRDLREGQAIRVLTGPFANVLGRLDRLDANGRVRVLLDIMGGEVPALLDRAALAQA